MKRIRGSGNGIKRWDEYYQEPPDVVAFFNLDGVNELTHPIPSELAAVEFRYDNNSVPTFVAFGNTEISIPSQTNAVTAPVPVCYLRPEGFDLRQDKPQTLRIKASAPVMVEVRIWS